MRSFVLDIIVIELCSAGGFPLEEASEATKRKKVVGCRYEEYRVHSKGKKIPFPLMSKGESKEKGGDLHK
jgi:hypothetical protein